MSGTPRRTNFLRPLHRLGWLLIWGGWLAVLILVVPVVAPPDDAIGWVLLSMLTTTGAYLLHRLWDWHVIGRPLPWAGQSGDTPDPPP